MSFSTLHIGASALTAAQRAVEVSAHNVANSTVEGYTRQRVQLAAHPPSAGVAGMRGSGMRGNGVQVVALERLRSTITDNAVRAEAGTAGSTEARAAVLDRAQGLLGAYGNGLPESLTKLWDAFSVLATDPSGPAARQIVVDAADRVATGLNDAAGELARIRTDTLTAAGEQVLEINSLAQQVADLNVQIVDALAAEQAPNDLLDTRDLALDRLATLTGATVKHADDGSVDVLVGGQVLVSGKDTVAVSLGSTPPPPGTTGDDPVVLLGGTAVTVGGALGGGVAVLTTDLRDVETRLDDFARAVVGAVNDQHAKGFDPAGAPGGPVFSGTRAADLQVDAALTPERLAAAGRATGGPLDGEAATALAKLRLPGPDGVSLGSRVVGLATLLGSRAADAARRADASAAGLTGLEDMRASQNGVSVDEEMVDLVKFQHSYDAAARVISMADGMLDTLINRMGAGR